MVALGASITAGSAVVAFSLWLLVPVLAWAAVPFAAAGVVLAGAGVPAWLRAR